ncbi:hypothetical protein GDO86_003289, partial [Hymenochirus boettgeri]
DCGPPPRLDYAELKPEFNNQTFPIGQEVKYICRPGYVRSGLKDSIVCLSDFRWSTLYKLCTRRQCPNPGDIQNGQMEAEDYLFGSRVTYTCNIGYNMISKYNYRVCLADGTWSNSLPICEVQRCSAPETVPHGTYNPPKEEYQYQDSVTYRCKNNMALVGEAFIFCTEAGNWSSVAPYCKAVNCPNPIVPNAIKTSGFTGPYLLNYAVTFKCIQGFDMFGSSTVQCNIDSNWAPSLPRCLGRCGLPPKLKYGQLKPTSTNQTHFSSGVRVEYDCAQGYLPVNGTNNTIICLSNATWSTPQVFCTKRSCGNPDIIENGQIEGEDYLFGSRVTYTCNIG